MTNPVPIRLPLIINGHITTNSEELYLSWQKKSEFRALISEYLDNGCTGICCPTYSANKAALKNSSLKENVYAVNSELISLTKSCCSNEQLIGVIGPSGNFIEPFGETSFSETIDIFYEQAKAFRASGIDTVLIYNIDYIGEIRAALLACNKCSLNVFVCISVDKYGFTKTGSSALSYLIPLQEVRVNAFGITGNISADGFSDILKELYRFSKIPLMAFPSLRVIDDEEQYDISPACFADKYQSIYKNGAVISGGGEYFFPQFSSLMNQLAHKYTNQIKDEKEDTSLILSNAKQVFYLSPDGIEVSSPISCTMDMSDVLLDVSNTYIDVIMIDIVTTDDAYQFSQNSYMSKLPVMFHSDDENALKLALLSYHGRAMIDSKCGIDPDELIKIANKYGSVIY